MADPTRKKNKGTGVEPSARILKLDSGDPLYIVTDHETPYQFRLQQFADGMRESVRVQSKRDFVPFSGRPKLIIEIAHAIRAVHRMAAPATCEAVQISLRWWWRFFDRINEDFPVNSVVDLDEMHYALYANLGDEMPSSGIASAFFKLVNVAREILNRARPSDQRLPPLLWTAKEKPPEERSLLPIDQVRHLYHHVKHLCFAAVRRYESDALAEPTLGEMNALFVMFVMLSGWNPSVVASIDIEDKSCVVPHPSNPQFSYVCAPKARANDNVQYALSRNKSAISPANIVRSVTQANVSMRESLKAYHAELLQQLQHLKRDRAEPKVLDALKIKIADVRQGLKSPWLYRQASNTPNYRGTVAEGIAFLDGVRLMAKEGKTALHQYALEINLGVPPSSNPVSLGISLRDLRDTFISWRWMSSKSWLDAMLAAGHTHRQSLVRYLKRKQIRERSRREFVKLGDAMWSSIMDARRLGKRATLSLAIAVKLENVSEEQIRRWMEGKDKTYCGTGCVDFDHPPKDIAPHHEKGTGCRIQRCTLCWHAILLPDSDDYLARRLAELRYQRARISEQSWQESNYPSEMENTQAALEYFEADRVHDLITKWETTIAKGDHIPVTMEGAYA